MKNHSSDEAHGRYGGVARDGYVAQLGHTHYELEKDLCAGAKYTLSRQQLYRCMKYTLSISLAVCVAMIEAWTGIQCTFCPTYSSHGKGIAFQSRHNVAIRQVQGS